MFSILLRACKVHSKLRFELFIFAERKPSLLELEKNISIRLVNSHTTTTRPRPTMPGLINVAGVHISPMKALPNDIQVIQVFFHLFISKKPIFTFAIYKILEFSGQCKSNWCRLFQSRIVCEEH